MKIQLELGVINIKTNKLLLSYIILITILKIINLNSIITSIFLILLLIFIENKEKSLVKILIMLIFAPNYIVIQFMILYVFIKFLLSKNKIKKDINFRFYILFIILSSVSYLFSIINDFSFTPLIIYAITVWCLYYMYFIFKSAKEDYIRVFYELCKLQIIPVSVQIIFLLVKKVFYPDLITGTFDNANTLVIVLMIYLILILNSRYLSFKNKLVNLIIYGSIILLADAKLILIIFILVLIITNVFTTTNKNIFLKLPIFCLFLGIIIIIMLSPFSLYKYSIDKYNIDKYITNNNMNLKFKAYKYTFCDLNLFNDLIGVGSGRYGSKAANILAYDTMYKTKEKLEVSKILKARTNQYYNRISSLFTKSFFNNIKNYSGILSYPQSSIVTIKGEIGYLGIMLFIFFILYNIKNLYKNILRKDNYKESYCSIVFILVIFLISFFDNFLEMNNIILSFMFILSSSYNYNTRKRLS